MSNTQKDQTEPAKPDVQFTAGTWKVRTHPKEYEGLPDDCFVIAPDVHGFPYDAEILGDDEYRDGMARKLADCRLIAQSPAMFEALERVVPKLEYSAEAFEIWGNFSAEMDLKGQVDSIRAILQAVKMHLSAQDPHFDAMADHAAAMESLAALRETDCSPKRSALHEARGKPILSVDFEIFRNGEVSMWTHFDHGMDFPKAEAHLKAIQSHLAKFIRDKSMCPFRSTDKEPDWKSLASQLREALEKSEALVRRCGHLAISEAMNYRPESKPRTSMILLHRECDVQLRGTASILERAKEVGL